MRALAVLFIAAASFAQTDGPATLPQRTPSTSFISSNPVQTIPIAGLQAALTTAQCGDSFNVLPGTWTGGLVMPSGCDAAHAITIKGQLGTQILECGSQTVKGGAFYVLDTLEATKPPACSVIYNFIAPGPGAHDLIFQNLNVHGDALTEANRGISLYGTTSVAILNSSVTDIHCLSVTGACGDSQAIAFGINDVPNGGNYLISGNSLSSSGEVILGGGGTDTTTPCDITITNNTLWKPSSWMPGSSDYAGKAWITKGLFELKNACRLLFDQNVATRTWGGYTQGGAAILLTPKNQGGTCPNCEVVDVTIRNSRIEHTGISMQIGCGASDSGALPLACGRWSIHDNEFLHQRPSDCYDCYWNWLVQLTSGSAPLLTDVSLTHNLFQVDRTGTYPEKFQGFLLLGSPTGTLLPRIHIDKNVFPEGQAPVYFTGQAAINCAAAGVFTSYAATFTNCWDAASTFTGNVILTTGQVNKLNATWPVGNYVVDAGPNPNTLP